MLPASNGWEKSTSLEYVVYHQQSCFLKVTAAAEAKKALGFLLPFPWRRQLRRGSPRRGTEGEVLRRLTLL